MEMPGKGTTGTETGDIMATVGKDTIAGIIGVVMAVGTRTTTTIRRGVGTGGGMDVAGDTAVGMMLEATTIEATTSEATTSEGMVMTKGMRSEDMVDTTSIISSRTKAGRVAGRHRTCGKAMDSRKSALE